MGMPGHISAQRFWRAEYQPANYDPTYKFFTLYELASKELSTKGHQDRVMTWELYVSSAMDFSNYKETYWDHVYGSMPYACYAEYGPENYNLVALIAPKDEGGNVEDVFTEDVINQLAGMDGVYAANLYRYGTDQMPKKTAAKERYTHELVIQLKDARRGCASWDAFVAENKAVAGLDISICNYVSMMPRLKECERWDTPRDRAIAALFHMFVSLPGFHAGSGYVKMTDVLTPAIKENLKKLEEKTE